MQTDPIMFKELSDIACATLKEKTAEPWDVDTMYRLGETFVMLLRCLSDLPHDKFKGTLHLLEVFCEHPECKKPGLPDRCIASIVLQLLSILRATSLGSEKTKEVNLCFVKFLTSLPAKFAYWSLLSVLKDEERHLSLVIKCIRKVEKQHTNQRQGCAEQRAEKEARDAMEVVLTSRQSVLALAGKARRQAWLEGAREIVEIARKWLPEVVETQFADAKAAAVSADEMRLLEELQNKDAFQIGGDASKENAPAAKTISTTNIISSETGLKAPANQTQPASSPCTARNA